MSSISSTIEYKIGFNRYFSVIHTFAIIEIAWNPPYFDSILDVKTLYIFFPYLVSIFYEPLIKTFCYRIWWLWPVKITNVESIASNRTFSWNIYLIDNFEIVFDTMICNVMPEVENFLILRLSNVYKWKMAQHLLALNMFNLLQSYFILYKNVKSFIHIVPPTVPPIVMRPGNIFLPL